MLQNMLLTALTPLSAKKETSNWENQPFTSAWPEKMKQKVKDITRTIKKKPKRIRTAFSTEQLRALERTYSRFKYIDTNRRNELAKSLDIGEKCIKIWFQNRRMKEKRESSESRGDSSNESLGNETPSVAASPPLQVKPNNCNSEYSIQYYQNNQSEYTYQLPTYFGVPQNFYGTQTHNITGFYNDNNVYPTNYYPVDINNYQGAEGNSFNNQFNNETNQYWQSNYGSYYAPI